MSPKNSERDGRRKSSDLPADIYQRLVESTRDYAMFILDTTGHVKTWTEGARAIKGYSASEIIGSHFSRFYPEDQVARGWPDYELAQAASLGRFEDENWRVRKDGSRFWANVVITALRDDAGELLGFAKVTRDLSERRAHEEALRQTEERFRLLVEGVADYAIFMLDTDGVVRTWNAGAEKLKGYTANEIIGSHISRFYPADAIKRGWPAHELRMATMDGRFKDEGWRLRKDGSRFWASVVITALRDAQGTLRGFSKITRDLTERKEAEQRLAESEELLRLLVQGITDYAIFMLDYGGVISSWNTGATAITGYVAEDMIGKHFSHFYTSEDVRESKPWQHLLAASETGRAADESWRVRKDGTQFWANTVISAVYDAEQKHRGYVHVMQDLTSRRHAESLAETTKRMHEFIAMLAHELRNPLAPISNAVELMRRRGLGDPTLEAMRDTIDRQVTTLSRIIDDLLDVNRIARGHFSVTRENLDIRDVVRGAIDSSKPLVDALAHTLLVSMPEEPVAIQGDPVRLTQVFVNLLNNAARYTPTGGRITVAVEPRATDVHIRIADNGRGVAASDLERIFDLFTQLEPQASGHSGGLGVGLALVRRVVELHAGTVRARSAGIGQGTEFDVVLPLPLERLNLVSDQSRSESRSKALRRLRVLVVDDNRDAAESLRALLQALGHDSYVVFDGATALTAVDRLHPHLVMLDIGMPGMSGYEVADAVRAMLGKDAPVLVAVTGWGQDSDKRLAQARGFNYHFTKPMSAAALRELLEAVADTRGST
jgi:PAS domain S-box-containing protein